MKTRPVIAIDGTLASGKGTIARRISEAFGLPHMDTGALYRATALSAMRRDVDLSDETAVAGIAAGLDLSGFKDRDLRTASVGQAASMVAALPAVRAALLELQRNFARRPEGAVLDGRDIGTVICPDADVKLWIDADLAERARRRRVELERSGQSISQAEMVAHLKERDARDRSREAAPMQKAEDAVLIDTTDLDIDAAVDKARAVVEAVLADK
ncbi:MAG: (d)CMP kinase [Pseudomonadota bacterium]